MRESHIWDRVTLGAQVGDSNVGDSVGVGEGEDVAMGAKKHKISQLHQPNA